MSECRAHPSIAFAVDSESDRSTKRSSRADGAKAIARSPRGADRHNRRFGPNMVKLP
jgi:hypothetical protein